MACLRHELLDPIREVNIPLIPGWYFQHKMKKEITKKVKDELLEVVDLESEPVKNGEVKDFVSELAEKEAVKIALVVEPDLKEIDEKSGIKAVVILTVDGKSYAGGGDNIEEALLAIHYPICAKTKGVFTAKVGELKSTTFLFPMVLRKLRCNKSMQRMTAKRLTLALKK